MKRIKRLLGLVTLLVLLSLPLAGQMYSITDTASASYNIEQNDQPDLSNEKSVMGVAYFTTGGLTLEIGNQSLKYVDVTTVNYQTNPDGTCDHYYRGYDTNGVKHYFELQHAGSGPYTYIIIYSEKRVVKYIFGKDPVRQT